MEIEKYTEDVNAYIDPSVTNPKSRYDFKTRLHLSDKTVKTRFIRKRDLDIRKTDLDKVYIVQRYQRYRPDLIALEAYGDANLAFVILAANNLKTIFDIVEGLQITIPSLTAIKGVNGVLMRS